MAESPTPINLKAHPGIEGTEWGVAVAPPPDPTEADLWRHVAEAQGRMIEHLLVTRSLACHEADRGRKVIEDLRLVRYRQERNIELMERRIHDASHALGARRGQVIEDLAGAIRQLRENLSDRAKVKRAHRRRRRA